MTQKSFIAAEEHRDAREYERHGSGPVADVSPLDSGGLLRADVERLLQHLGELQAASVREYRERAERMAEFIRAAIPTFPPAPLGCRSDCPLYDGEAKACSVDGLWCEPKLLGHFGLVQEQDGGDQ